MKPIKWHLWKIKDGAKFNLLKLRYIIHTKSWWKNLYDKTFFDGVAYKCKDKWLGRNGDRARCQAIKVLEDNLKGTTVFEFGAGKGYYSNLMRQWGYSVTQTDFAIGKVRFDIASDPLPMKFDNVVGMGVLHHIMNNKRFDRALKNIKAMTNGNIVLGVKLGDKPRGVGIKQRPLSRYITVLGKPTTVEDAGYLTIVVFNNGLKNKNGPVVK